MPLLDFVSGLALTSDILDFLAVTVNEKIKIIFLSFGISPAFNWHGSTRTVNGKNRLRGDSHG
jgi:hypothetical protein